MQTELIIVSEYCQKCHIEPYYDLSINMEGIDAIHHMLERMDDMRREITSLRKQLLLFREREIEEADW